MELAAHSADMGWAELFSKQGNQEEKDVGRDLSVVFFLSFLGDPDADLGAAWPDTDAVNAMGMKLWSGNARPGSFGASLARGEGPIKRLSSCKKTGLVC